MGQICRMCTPTGGGGNGYNLRTWKKDLQERLCDAFGLTVTLSHSPTGCSKWNPVECRLFSHLSMNWSGQPLRSLDVMLAFIRGTTTVHVGIIPLPATDPLTSCFV